MQSAKVDFSGVKALVVGLAREGTALARFLAQHGAQVTVTDAKPAETLAENVAALAAWPVAFALGGHPFSLLDDVDLVFVSPGVPLQIPLLREAAQRGLPLSSETRLFTRLCPAQIIGITGSSGKTTTTALVGEMLKAAGRRTWVGGNIGRPLIGHLGAITAGDVVVMELSSFQLEFFAPWAGPQESTTEAREHRALLDPAGWSPPIAAILNLTPNHLDRHSTMEAYIAAKAHILNHQGAGDMAILNLDDPLTRQMGKSLRSARASWFSMERQVEEGAFLRSDELILRQGSQEQLICRAEELQLMGRHNVANTLAACTLAGAAGAPAQALRRTATYFKGVEHRLELVRTWNGVRWYNDSIATTPERTVAALKAIDAPIVLLAGGRDKHLPWNDMAAVTWAKVHHLILFGEAAQLIEAAMQEARSSKQAPGRERAATAKAQRALEIHHAGTLEEATELAAQVARPGDAVLLSPGGTSYDAYQDFVERGKHFRKLVRGLE
jgi:UDP-N-acetylmuramoylalanine--D-glutamate ligase